ncbi:unnamed protein product [Symbiodinium sp. CCMP2592]|nr:unnamed protein product [Symbiodinium sp. CCMP2592]
MEFDPDSPSLSQAFLAASFGVEALIAGRLAYRAWNQKSPLWRALRFLRWTLKWFILGPPQSASAGCGMIRREALALRYSIGRKIVGINTALLLVVVVSMQLRMIFTPDLPPVISFNLSWTIVGHLLWMAVAFVVPQIARNDLWFTFYSLLLVAYVLPYVDSLDGSTRVAYIVFSLFRFPAIVMARRAHLVLLSNLPFLGTITYRALTEESTETYGGLSAVLGMEFLHLMLLTAAAYVFDAYLAQRVELAMEKGNALTQLNAASALLQLTCDAVVELDEELRLIEHSNELAAMLLRDSVAGGRGGTLKGVLFTDLMPPLDAPPAIAKLSMFRSSGSSSHGQPAQAVRAHAFHTRLVDSWSTKLRTEVLQVMYTKMDGQTCHLVGLRDFTDSKPFALSRGPTGDGEEAEELASVDSFPISPSSRHSEQWLPQSLYGRGMLFLDVDVERLCIHAASAPLMDLVGSATSHVFPAAHTLQLLERIHSEGRLLLERGEQPPSKIYSFDEMPAVLGGTTPDPITGTMHLIQAQLGLNVLVAFQPSMQVQNSNSSIVSDRRSSRRLASVHSRSQPTSPSLALPTLQDVISKRPIQL